MIKCPRARSVFGLRAVPKNTCIDGAMGCKSDIGHLHILCFVYYRHFALSLQMLFFIIVEPIKFHI